MQELDASSIIYGWDNYPIQQFPPLWNWLADQVSTELAITQVAFEEVRNMSPDCADWLIENYIDRKPITSEILSLALIIKNALGIEGDNYHSKGVGENDILIIASAKISRVELISDENRQNSLPRDLQKYKIPAVCHMDSVSVQCINFVDYIKQSNQVFI